MASSPRPLASYVAAVAESSATIKTGGFDRTDETSDGEFYEVDWNTQKADETDDDIFPTLNFKASRPLMA